MGGETDINLATTSFQVVAEARAQQGKAHSQLTHYVADFRESNFMGESSWKEPQEGI